MQGQNIDTTWFKQNDFEAFAKMHTRICAGVIKKPRNNAHKCAFYIDLNAGSGYNEEACCEGSPIRFLRRAVGAGLPLEAYLLEKDTGRCRELTERLSHFGQSDLITSRVLCGDHRKTISIVKDRLASIPAEKYGLIYTDENGAGTPFDLLRELAAQNPRLDILCSINANAIKRCRGAGLDYEPLFRSLESVGKKYCNIRKSFGNWQWTFAFLTDWSGSPDLQNMGFFDLRDERGQYIAKLLTYSEKEREEDPFFEPMRLPTRVVQRPLPL